MSWKKLVDAERIVVAPPPTARRADATVDACTCASSSPGRTKAPATSMTRPFRDGRASRPARRTRPRAKTIVAFSVTSLVAGSSSRAPVSVSGGAIRRGARPVPSRSATSCALAGCGRARSAPPTAAPAPASAPRRVSPSSASPVRCIASTPLRVSAAAPTVARAHSSGQAHSCGRGARREAASAVFRQRGPRQPSHRRGGDHRVPQPLPVADVSPPEADRVGLRAGRTEQDLACGREQCILRSSRTMSRVGPRRSIVGSRGRRMASAAPKRRGRMLRPGL